MENINKNNIVNNNLSSFNKKENYSVYNFFNIIHSINKEINKDKIFQSQIKKFKEIKEIKIENYSRSSKFRGVSKNGNKWQVFKMINKKNKYFGTYDSEEIAARVYDIVSLKNKGLKAKTNFKYNISEANKILEDKILMNKF